jgi:hypothetical protein
MRTFVFMMLPFDEVFERWIALDIESASERENISLS